MRDEVRQQWRQRRRRRRLDDAGSEAGFSTALSLSHRIALVSIALFLLFISISVPEPPRSHIHGCAAESRSKEGHGGSPAATNSTTTTMHGSFLRRQNDAKTLFFYSFVRALEMLDSCPVSSYAQIKRGSLRSSEREEDCSLPERRNRAPREKRTLFSSLVDRKFCGVQPIRNTVDKKTSTSDLSLFFLTLFSLFRFGRGHIDLFVWRKKKLNDKEKH